MSFFQNSTSNQGDKDIEISDPPSDSISCMSFSGTADFLAAGSWDNNVCIRHRSDFRAMSVLLKFYRSGYTRSTTKANPKAKLCIHTKDPYSQCVGIKYVDHLNL